MLRPLRRQIRRSRLSKCLLMPRVRTAGTVMPALVGPPRVHFRPSIFWIISCRRATGTDRRCITYSINCLLRPQTGRLYGTANVSTREGLSPKEKFATDATQAGIKLIVDTGAYYEALDADATWPATSPPTQ